MFPQLQFSRINNIVKPAKVTPLDTNIILVVFSTTSPRKKKDCLRIRFRPKTHAVTEITRSYRQDAWTRSEFRTGRNRLTFANEPSCVPGYNSQTSATPVVFVHPETVLSEIVFTASWTATNTSFRSSLTAINIFCRSEHGRSEMNKTRYHNIIFFEPNQNVTWWLSREDNPLRAAPQQRGFSRNGVGSSSLRRCPLTGNGIIFSRLLVCDGRK